MNKKIWIAGFFVILIMLMPFKSVAVTNEIKSIKNIQKENDGLEVLNDNNLTLNAIKQIYLINPYIALEKLIVRLQNSLNWVLKSYADNPKIVSICQKLTDIISLSTWWRDTPFCNTLKLIAWLILFLECSFEPGSLAQIIFLFILFSYMLIWALLCYDGTSTRNEDTAKIFDMSLLANIIGTLKKTNTCPCVK